MNIELNELAALLRGSATSVAQRSTISGQHIVVLDRGFVYVGRCEIQGDYLLIKDARNIRRWGTTKGLGQLANSGPTPQTVIEETGDLSVPIKALIFILQCKIQF